MNPLKQNRSILSVVVLVVGLVLTTAAAAFAYRAFDADEAIRYQDAIDEIHNDMQSRLDFFATSIKQLAAVYATHPSMTEAQFEDFTLTTGIRANDSGTFSYGIFLRKPGAVKDRYFLHLRATGEAAPGGAPRIGTEVSDNQPRVALFKQAVETAKPVLATFVPGLRNSKNNGQMMTAAAYSTIRVPESVDERRKAAIGIAYARFSQTGLFDQALRNAGTFKSKLELVVYDGSIAQFRLGHAPVLYHHQAPDAPKLQRATLFEVQVGGRPFTVRVVSPSSSFQSTAMLIAVLMLAIGVALSLFAFRVIRQGERRSERLFKSERQLQLVTESLPVLISYIDDQMIYRFNNRVYEDVLGKSRTDITGHSVYELHPTNHALHEKLKRALKGERIEMDVTIKHHDGVARRYHQVLQPDFNHRGTVKGVVGMHTDITDRARAQERAHFLEDVSSILATSLDPGVVAEKLTQRMLQLCDWCVIELLDDENKIVRHLWAASTADRYERLQNFYEDYPPNSNAKRLTTVARETKRTQYREHVTRETLTATIEDPRRLERFLDIGFKSIVVCPLLSGEKVLGTMAMYASDERAPYTHGDVEFFEEIATRSSLAFENARLYAESQNLNRAKDHFLAMLSHELRTPMNVILGWLEILTTEDVDAATYAQALDTLNRNANVQIQLINDLLDVSRIINGKLSLHAEKGNIGAIVKGAVDSVQPAVRAKHIECTVRLEGALEATVDSERIQQVLWNLLSNAVKFTPQGGRISVSAIGDADDVRISVTDSGIGIESTFLPYVFDRFRQEEGGFTRQQGGLGLGLSIVRYIVEGHGGTIQVTSPGRHQGTTFTVVLPKVAQIQDEIQLAPSEPSIG